MDVIPQIIHQVWVGEYPMPEREAGFVEGVKALHPEYQHHLWTTKPRNLTQAASRAYNVLYEQRQYALCADIVRLWMTHQYGGFYLDVDFSVTASLEPLRASRAVFFYHPSEDDRTIPNNVFGAARGSDIMRYVLRLVAASGNSWHGPSWFGEVVKGFFGLDNDTAHATVKAEMAKHNVAYLSYPEFEAEYARHHSLYSWSPQYHEAKKKEHPKVNRKDRG